MRPRNGNSAGFAMMLCGITVGLYDMTEAEFIDAFLAGKSPAEMWAEAEANRVLHAQRAQDGEAQPERSDNAKGAKK